MLSVRENYFMDENIKCIGVEDFKIDLFEGQYTVPNGMLYNSYAILDDKVAVLDTVDAEFTTEWLENIEKALSGRQPDYLVVHHMEPDHSANISVFMEKYPNAQIVSSRTAFAMMNYFFGTDFGERKIVIAEGSKLSLGKHELTFIAASMVHWPEVMMSYESHSKTLFSADAFGTFGTARTLANPSDWDDEARRYYIGIVGKYGKQVIGVLDKAAKLDIETICSLHGPVLEGDLGHFVGLYKTWASYVPEAKGVVVAYASIYGNTKKAAETVAQKLKEKGEEVQVFDLARCDMYAAVANAFKYDRLVLASSTYNGSTFPCMRFFLEHLVDRNFQHRKVSLIENGSWAPMASKTMKSILEQCEGVIFTDEFLTLRISINDDTMQKIDILVEKICNQ